MVSKNNRIERMEQTAERQSHFGIRKLTIGAASVLLGTTLWLGNNANVAKADTNTDKGDIDEANQETANPIQYGAASAKKAINEVPKLHKNKLFNHQLMQRKIKNLPRMFQKMVM